MYPAQLQANYKPCGQRQVSQVITKVGTAVVYYVVAGMGAEVKVFPCSSARLEVQAGSLAL